MSAKFIRPGKDPRDHESTRANSWHAVVFFLFFLSIISLRVGWIDADGSHCPHSSLGCMSQAIFNLGIGIGPWNGVMNFDISFLCNVELVNVFIALPEGSESGH